MGPHEFALLHVLILLRSARHGQAASKARAHKALHLMLEGTLRLFLCFLGKMAVQAMSGKTPGSPRRPSSRHPRPSGFL